MKKRNTTICLIIAIMMAFSLTIASTDTAMAKKKKGIKYTSYAVSVKTLKKNKHTVDLRKMLPAKYRKKYVVAQGGDTDGKYAYQIFEPKKGNKCVVLKYNPKTMTKVKVSKPILLDHGNDMTYNPNTKKLYVVHWDGRPRRITMLNKDTLKVVGTKDIKVKAGIPGVSKSEAKKTKSFASIAFNKARNQYVLRISKRSRFLVLDKKLKPVRMIHRKGSFQYRPQSIVSDKGHIYVALDNVGKANYVKVYNWKGKYQYKITIKNKYEVQNLYKFSGKWRSTMHHGRDTKQGFKRSAYVYNTPLKQKFMSLL